MQPASSPEPPTAPLPTLVWSRQHDYRLKKSGPSSLAIVSRFGPLLHFSLVTWFLLLALVAAGIALGEFNHWLQGVLWIACAVCILISLALLLLPLFTGPFLVQTRFDRAPNRLNLAPWGIHPRQKMPLDRVTGVQLLSVGCRDDEEGAYASYQLNLVLQNERVNLIENGNPAALQKIGAEIAAFLQVPMVEQTASVPVNTLPAEPMA